jgi:all-trans-retinol 13,14-reductase
MRIGTSYKQHGITGDYDAIVIGSGIGGLASAALLAKHAGKRVLVLERHYTAGGFTHTFTRKGYEWDVGVHYIGEVTHPKAMLRQVFDDITGGALEWADMGEVYDTIVIGDDRYDLVKGRDNFRRKLAEYFPGEREAIDRYVARVKATVRKGQAYFMHKALPGPIAMMASPFLRRPLLRESRQTTAEVLAEITDNKRLRAVLAGQYGDYGLPPGESSFFMHSLVVNHYFEGGAYPVGGSQRIAETILPVIEAAGGKVMTNAEVAEILVDGRRAVGVRLADGVEVRAPAVISDAGVALTFGRLLPKPIADRFGFTERLSRTPPSVSHVSLYVGLEQTAEQLGLGKTNLWIYPDEDHDASVARYSADPEAPLPVAYISFPSAKDPDFQRRYPGKATIEVVTLAPWEWFAQWDGTRWNKRGDDYEAFKQRLADRLTAELLRQCPQLEGNIAHAELSTPLSTKNFAAHPRGEIYGLSHTPDRFEQRWLKPTTPIRGLYLTGADICSAGIGGALFGGVITASAMLKRSLQAAITEGAAAVHQSQRTAA